MLESCIEMFESNKFVNEEQVSTINEIALYIYKDRRMNFFTLELFDRQVIYILTV